MRKKKMLVGYVGKNWLKYFKLKINYAGEAEITKGKIRRSDKKVRITIEEISNAKT